jgi:hypothetical protein
MNDKFAASILACLLAKGLLVEVWVPPKEIRELRGLANQAKNRLHAVLQRHHLLPLKGNPSHVAQQLHAGRDC